MFILLGLNDNGSRIDDEIIRTTMFHEPPTEITDNETKYNSGLEQFREETIDESLPRQRFIVSQEDGMEEFKKDILGC